MMRQEFYFSSKSGFDSLHAIRWVPEGKTWAVLQIVHGMAEHIERYDEFARYLAERGVAVVGHSHLGHGKSVKSDDDLGFFAEPEGNACVIGDIHELRMQTQKDYPDVPYFLLGHSMGSFLVRQYLGAHSQGLSAAIIMGSADMPQAALKGAKAACRMIAARKGWRHRSAFINSLVVGGFEKKMGMAWLSRSEENVKAYAADPHCGFCFTLNAFYHMFSGVEAANRNESAGRIPRNIPLLFISGAEDPVGGNGKAVTALYERYRRHGAKAQLRLIEQDRHEILQETDRFEIFDEIYNWMNIKEI